VAYLGNLTCRDCGLTFTSRWGALEGKDEYRCESDHVVLVDQRSGVVVALDGAPLRGVVTLVTLRGRCPTCRTELATGRLPRCPVCGSREHDVLLAGTLG
jgi:DNA-directed RNA polymerase subunit RPC12/RpoP